MHIYTISQTILTLLLYNPTMDYHKKSAIYGTTWTAKGAGPIGPCPTSLDNKEERMRSCSGEYYFDKPTFYSRIADTFILSSVSIQYMNGKTTLSGERYHKHISYKDPK